MTSVSEQSQAPQGCRSWCEQHKPRQKSNFWSPTGPGPENTDLIEAADSGRAQWEHTLTQLRTLCSPGQPSDVISSKKSFPCPHIPGLPCFRQDHEWKSPNPRGQSQAGLHFQCTEPEEVLETPRESFWLLWRGSHGRLIKPKCSNQNVFCLCCFHFTSQSFPLVRKVPGSPQGHEVPHRGLS